MNRTFKTLIALCTLVYSLPSLGQGPGFSTSLSIEESFVCKGGSITLKVGTIDAQSYQLQFYDVTEWKDFPGYSGAANSGEVAITFANYTSPFDFRVKIADASNVLAFSNSVSISPQEPTIDFDPIDLVGCNGSSDAIFKTKGTGVAPLSYAWEISEGGAFSPITSSGYSGVSSSNLSIDGLTNGDDGDSFRCRISDANGCEIITNSASLSINRHSVIQPTTSTEFCEGGVATFQASNVVGVVSSYQWASNGSGGTYSDLVESVKFENVDSDILTVNGIEKGDRNFRLIIAFEETTMDDGGNPVFATCEVTQTRTGYTINDRPAFSGLVETLKERCDEGTLLYEVASPGNQYHWYSDTASTLIDSGVSFETPSIKADKIFFVKYVDDNSCESDAIELEAVINPLPEISSITVPPICPTASSFSLSFFVEDGQPDLFSIEAGTEALQDFTAIVDGNFVGSSLSVAIPMNSQSDTYDFDLSISNSLTKCVSQVYPIELTIQNLTEVTLQPTASSECEGATATISINAAGEGAISYQWFKGANLLNGEEGSSLVMSNVNNLSEGNYFCQISAICGSVNSDLANFSLKQATEVVTQPSSQKVCAGLPARFMVEALASNPVVYQWYENNVPIGINSNELEIPSPLVEQNGNAIFCKVTGACGELNSEFVDLEVEAAPPKPQVNVLNYCINEIAVPIEATINTTGNNLIWYDKDLNVLTEAPTPNTAIEGIQTFYVSEKSPGACEGAKTEVNIEVYPQIVTEIAAELPFICESGEQNRTRLLTANSTGGDGNYQYRWAKVGGSANLGNASSLSVLETGLYYLITNSATCRDSTAIEITNPVGPLVSPKITVDGVNFPSAVSVCPQSSIELFSTFNQNDVSTIWLDGSTVIGNSSSIELLSIETSSTIYTKNTKTTAGFTCESNIASIGIGLKAIPEVEIAQKNVSCTGLSDGEITLSPTGTLQPYSYQINSEAFQAEPHFEDLATGTYILTVKNSQGCFASETVTLSSGIYPSIISQPTSLYNCEGLTVTFETELDNYSSLQWQQRKPGENWVAVTGENENDLRLTKIGNADNPHLSEYRLLINNGTCEVQTEAAKLFVSGFTENLENAVVCLGGDISFMPPAYNGVISNYEWQERLTTSSAWNTIQNSTLPELLLASRQSINDGNAYRVKVTFDKNGDGTCLKTSDLGSLEVRELILNSEISEPLCHGESNGAFDLNLSNGDKPFAYRFGTMDYQESGEFNGLPAGDYLVSAKDAFGCEISKEISIVDPEEITIDKISISDVTCFGLADGEIELTGKGGTGLLTYLWSSESEGKQLPSGNYEIIIEDENSCLLSTSVVINQPPAIEIQLVSSEPSTCDGLDGNLVVDAQGGSGGFEYQIGSGSFQNTGDFIGFTGGEYIVTVEDNSGCQQFAQFEIGIQRDFNLDDVILDQESCEGIEDGKIEIITSGSAELMFSLNDLPFGVSNTFSNLTGGEYTIHTKSASGCTKDTTVVLPTTVLPVFDKQPIDQINCKGNTVNFEAKILVYSNLQWQKMDSGNWEDIEGENDLVLKISNVGSSINPHLSQYRLKAQNQACELVSSSAKLLVNSIESNFEEESVCYGNSLSLNVGDLQIIGIPASFQWQFREGTSGAWSDFEGENQAQISFSPITTMYVRCRVDFEKDGSSTCLEYSATNGTKISVVEISETQLSAGQEICEGEKATLKATGCNGEVVWSNGEIGAEIEVQPNANITYTANCEIEGCSKSAIGEIEIKVNGSISVPVIASNSTQLCLGEKTLLTATECNDEVVWNTDETGISIEVSPELTTSYFAKCVSLTCESDNSNEITIEVSKEVLPGLISEILTENCSGYNPTTLNSIEDASGGYDNEELTYFWEYSEDLNEANPIWTKIDGAEEEAYNPSVLQKTTWVRRGVESSCAGDLFSNISKIVVNPDPSLTIASSKLQICSNESFILSAKQTGGAGECEYEWQKNEKSSAPSSSFWEDLSLSGEVVTLSDIVNSEKEIKEIYFRAIIDCQPSSCNKFTSDAFAVLVEPSFDFDFNVGDTTLCVGNEMLIEIQNCGGLVSWSDGYSSLSRSFVAISSVSYEVTCSSICGSSTKTLNINVIPGLVTPQNTTPISAIVPNSIQFSASGTALKWYDDSGFLLSGAPVVTELGEHIYFVTQSNETCESARLAVRSVIYEPLQILSSSKDQYDCEGNGVKFDVQVVGVARLNYRWQRKRPDETSFINLNEDDKNVKNVFTNYLTVSSVGKAENPNGSQFRCQISDSLGNVTSRTMTLYANILDGLIPNRNSCVGQTYSMEIKDYMAITGDVLSFQWQKRNDEIDEWIDLEDTDEIKGTASSRITFPEAQIWHSGKYRCSVTFNTGGFQCIENTDQSVLTVGEFPDLPIVTTTEYCQGERTKTLDYRAEKGNDERWYESEFQEVGSGTNKAPKPSSFEAGSIYYWVSQVTKQNCVGPRERVEVIIHPQPEPPQNTTPTYVDEGGLLEFTAKGEGLRWFTSRTGRSYTANNPIYQEIDTYRHYVSQVSNYSCESERTLIESAIVGKLGFIQEPVDLSECDGNTVTFKVKGKGKGSLSYQWYRKSPNTEDFVQIENAIGDEYKIADAGEGLDLDQSIYKCEIKDSTGTVISQEAKLIVNKIDGKLTDSEVCQGSDYKLDFTDLNISGLVATYVFQKRVDGSWVDIIESSNQDLVIPRITKEDEGSYRLRVNFVSEIRSTCPRNFNSFELIVNDLPKPNLENEATLCSADELSSIFDSESISFYNSKAEFVTYAKELDNSKLYFKINGANGCVSALDSIEIVINESPKLDIAQTSFSTCLNQTFDLPNSLKDIEIQWFKGLELLESTPEIVASSIGVESDYFVQKMGYNNCLSEPVQLTFESSFCIADQPTSCQISSLNSPESNIWSYFSDANGKIIAAINPGRQDLGEVQLSYNIKQSSSDYLSENGTVYLPRYFNLVSERQIQETIKMRFYFEENEVNDHYDLVDPNEQSNSGMSWVMYSGSNQDCELNNNDNFIKGKAEASSKLIEPIAHYSGSYFFEIEVQESSEIGFTANVFNENSTISFIENNKRLSIKYEAQKEIRALKYIVEKRLSESNWVVLPVENESSEDLFLKNGEFEYRLIFVDKDGVRKLVDQKSHFVKTESPICFTFPNPVKSISNLAYFVANMEVSEIELIDIRSQKYPVIVTENREGFNYLSVPTALRDGKYILRIKSSAGEICTWQIVKD